MESKAVLSCPGMDFNAVCRMLRVPPADLGEIVWKELGMTGDDVFEMLKNSFVIGRKNY